MSLARAIDLRPEDLAGRTWAGYVRESTRGQADRYGPEIQRTEQARFAERHGLVADRARVPRPRVGQGHPAAVGLRADGRATPRPARSRCCSSTTRAASRATSRTPTPTATGSPRPASTVVFCADGLIAGNVDTYELEGLKTVADAAYIRRLSRNVGRGYEQKWRLFDDPGRPRAARASPGPASAGCWSPSRVRTSTGSRRAFALYATGTWSDTTLADELGLTEAGLAEILTNPLYAGRVIRHKGRPDEEERPARFAAPVDPALFERVQAIRERAAHPPLRAAAATRGGPYPLVRLMRCVDCESGYHGDATATATVASATPAAGLRPVGDLRGRALRGAGRAAVRRRSASTEADIAPGARARCGGSGPRPVDPTRSTSRRPAESSSAQLAAGEITLDAFSRAWRRAGSAGASAPALPDELRLRRARQALWRSSGRCGGTRRSPTGCARRRCTRSSPGSTCDGPETRRGASAAERERVAARATRRSQAAKQHVGMVGARGFEPPTSSSRTMRATKLRHAPTESRPLYRACRMIAQRRRSGRNRRPGRGVGKGVDNQPERPWEDPPHAIDHRHAPDPMAALARRRSSLLVAACSTTSGRRVLPERRRADGGTLDRRERGGVRRRDVHGRRRERDVGAYLTGEDGKTLYTFTPGLRQHEHVHRRLRREVAAVHGRVRRHASRPATA